MAWIKRNLFFTVGGVIALLLLGASGYYNYRGWSDNRTKMAALQDAYNQLQGLLSRVPSPGNEEVDNIQAAKDQEQQLADWIASAKAHFKPTLPIPNPPDGTVTTEEFAGSLRKTIQDMQQEAASENVQLPSDYSFSFTAERNLVTFTPGSLNALATHLGDVKAICDILFDAKVNALDGIQREVVSDNDTTGPQSDYLADKTAQVNDQSGNSMATLTPYVVTIRCFSSDLGDVLSKLASSDYCFIVKDINVLPAGGATQAANGENPTSNLAPAPMPTPTSGYTPSGGNGGLQTVLDEQLLQVTLAIEIVKLTK